LESKSPNTENLKPDSLTNTNHKAMYLIVDRNTGSVLKSKILTSDNYSDCVFGHVALIDIRNPAWVLFYNPKELSWESLDYN
jgi:hypothetical protein